MGMPSRAKPISDGGKGRGSSVLRTSPYTSQARSGDLPVTGQTIFPPFRAEICSTAFWL